MLPTFQVGKLHHTAPHMHAGHASTAMQGRVHACACMQVIGAPTIFNGLWSMLQPLVDPVSRKKIHMLPCALRRAISTILGRPHVHAPDAA